MPIEITAVQGRRQLGEFIDLPFRLHAGTPWVTPLLVERKAFLSKRLNAFFKHGEAEYFLARRDGRVVGRITAQIDFAYNQFHGTRTGMFGFIEFEDDPEILRALLGTVEAWLVARGCDQMLGPMDFSLNEEGGILIEGFELRTAGAAELASALLPAADRGRGADQGDGPPLLETVGRRPDEDEAGDRETGETLP